MAQVPDGKRVDLIHAVPEIASQPRALLDADVAAAGVTLHLMRDREEGLLTGAPLREMLPDWSKASVWFCGPVAFGEALRRDLVAHGLPPAGFHQELFNMRFDGVPEGVDLRALQALLESLPGVQRVHDLHVWAMGTSQVAMTAHLVMPQGHADDAFLKHATDELHERFEIEHVTLQFVRIPFTHPCAALDRAQSRVSGSAV